MRNGVKTMRELEEIRNEINGIDSDMAGLFKRRMECAKEVALYKKEHGLSVKDAAREAEVVERCRHFIDDETVQSYYVSFLKNNIELSCAYQSRLNGKMTVAYSGIEGAYADIAALEMFPEASTESYGDFADAYHAVEKGEADCAVLPIENSYAGEVGAVMDLLFSGELYVNSVFDLPIRHCLVACEGATVGEIRKVVSHPQALHQCADFVKKHGFETEEFSNTAAAAKYIKEQGANDVAAIASEKTAEMLGLCVLERGVNDVNGNTTRFAALSRVPNGANKNRSGENFILVFTVQNRAGALAQTLNIIGAHGFNMRSLRSRPMKGLQWNYYFYVEAEGNIHNSDGENMMRELSAVCARLKLVGTFGTERIAGEIK